MSKAASLLPAPPMHHAAASPGASKEDSDGLLACGCIHANPRAASTPTRLALPYFVANCASPGAGLGARELPAPLAAQGVSGSAWAAFTAELDAAQRGAVPGLCVLGAIIPYTALLCLLPCTVKMARYHAALAAALARFNAHVLAPRGLHAMLQTTEHSLHMAPLHISASGGHCVSWLAIALTAADADALRAEPRLWVPSHPPCARSDSILPHPCAV